MFRVLAAREKRPALTLRQRLIWLGQKVIITFAMFYIVFSVAGLHYFTTALNRHEAWDTPANYGQVYEEVNFPAAIDHLTIRGWYVPAGSEKVVLVVHGKDSSRDGSMAVAMPLAKQNINLLLIDLRGHGTSEGSNHSLGFYEQRDVLGALAWLKGRGFKPEHTGILGYSMGAATALNVMGTSPDVKAMVSDSAFAHLGRELNYAFPLATSRIIPGFFLGGILLAGSVLRGIDVNALNPEEAVRHLNGRKVLLIHGQKDQLVPVNDVYRLEAAAHPYAVRWVVDNAPHVGAYRQNPDEYLRRLLEFFQREL